MGTQGSSRKDGFGTEGIGDNGDGTLGTTNSGAGGTGATGGGGNQRGAHDVEGAFGSLVGVAGDQIELLGHARLDRLGQAARQDDTQFPALGVRVVHCGLTFSMPCRGSLSMRRRIWQTAPVMTQAQDPTGRLLVRSQGQAEPPQRRRTGTDRT